MRYNSVKMTPLARKVLSNELDRMKQGAGFRKPKKYPKSTTDRRYKINRIEREIDKWINSLLS